MITKEQVKLLKVGDTLYHTRLKGKDKRPVRVLVECRPHVYAGKTFSVMLVYKGIKHLTLSEKTAEFWAVTEKEAADAQHIKNVGNFFAVEKEPQP